MDQKLLKTINDYNKSNVALYSPVYVKDELYYEWKSKRSFESQKIRLNLLPKDFNQESILDVGCNSGFFALYLRKYHNAGDCIGVDINQLLPPIWNRILELENIDRLCYKIIDDKTKIKIGFDNILLLSVADINDGNYIGLGPLLDKYSKLTKKSLYVEPTNHGNISRDQIVVLYQKYFSNWGEPVFLGHTDYQNRPLFRIDV